MKIGLLVAFAGRNCGGPEVYEREMVRAISAAGPQHEYHLYCLDRRAREVIGASSANLVYHLLKPSMRPVSLTTSLPLVLARTRPDVFHALVIPPPLPPSNMVMMLPCSTLARHPHLFPPLVRIRLRFLYHRGIPRASTVICPSEHVRDVVIEDFRLAPSRLPVIPPGVSKLFQPFERSAARAMVQERYGIRHPYFLFSGRWEHRKNVPRIIEAFALFKRESDTEHRLVMTGQQTWAAEEAKKVIERLGVHDMIIDLGTTPLDELPYLYSAADALVYTSLWEGFGMPIVESMAAGTPVITSNLSAMPETAGDAALIVDPYSVEDIAAAMHRIGTDPGLRTHLRAKGLERAKLFTWEGATRKTLDLYHEIAESGEFDRRNRCIRRGSACPW